MGKRRIAILGSTGSIGTQALDVIRRHRDLFEVELLSAYRRRPTSCAPTCAAAASATTRGI